MWYIDWIQTGKAPDWIIRQALRVMLPRRLRSLYSDSPKHQLDEKQRLVSKFKESPIAIRTQDPNQQHYEVPTEFFKLVLGKWLKYSCCYWPEGVSTLQEAEEAMLALTCQRAELADGMRVLDLGCGWGSLSLWIAGLFPSCNIVAVSNSSTQREFIQQQAESRGLDNLDVITADIADFAHNERFQQMGTFDRVLSIEMFEHMKNYQGLLQQIAGLLKRDGLLFVHIFSHREFAWEFNADDSRDWMAQTFFSGGTMPSDDLLLYFQEDLSVAKHWRLDGRHYEKTLNAWLKRLDDNIGAVRRIIADTYGKESETRWLANWRLFFLACSEVWGLNRGQEYLVSHYLFRRKTVA